MADSTPPQETTVSIDVSKRSISMSGRDTLTALLMAMIVASWVYIAHFRIDTLDKTHAQRMDAADKSHADIGAAIQKALQELMRLETDRSKQIEELLRINQRNTASLEIIAARIGRSLAPYEENRGAPSEPRRPRFEYP